MSELLPGPGQAAAFATAVFVLNATPGVDFLLTLSRTLQGGARAGVAAALGIGLGCGVHALAAAFGLAALLALYPVAFGFIQWAGAAYLAWLGAGLLHRAWRGESGPAADASPVAPRSLAADLRGGMLTNVLNPKVALFFLAFLPQFVPADSPNPTLSFLLLGGWFVVQGLVFLLGLVLVAARLRRWQSSAAARRLLGGLGGGLFIALALRLLVAKPAAA